MGCILRGGASQLPTLQSPGRADGSSLAVLLSRWRAALLRVWQNGQGLPHRAPGQRLWGATHNRSVVNVSSTFTSKLVDELSSVGWRKTRLTSFRFISSIVTGNEAKHKYVYHLFRRAFSCYISTTNWVCLFFIKILEAGLLLTAGVIVFIAFFLCELLQTLTTVLKTRILNWSSSGMLVPHLRNAALRLHPCAINTLFLRSGEEVSVCSEMLTFW